MAAYISALPPVSPTSAISVSDVKVADPIVPKQVVPKSIVVEIPNVSQECQKHLSQEVLNVLKTIIGDMAKWTITPDTGDHKVYSGVYLNIDSSKTGVWIIVKICATTMAIKKVIHISNSSLINDINYALLLLNMYKEFLSLQEQFQSCGKCKAPGKEFTEAQKTINDRFNAFFYRFYRTKNEYLNPDKVQFDYENLKAK